MDKKIRTGASILLTAGLFLFIASCSEDTVNTGGSVDLTGAWQLATNMTSNSCGEIESGTEIDTITVIQCGNDVTVIVREGYWGTGTLDGDRLTFTGTTIDDEDGCISTRVSNGVLTVSSSQLEGTFTTSITFDAATCGTGMNCTVEHSADVSLLRYYETGCLERDDFGIPSQSEYILPYPAGKSYLNNNSYCAPLGGHRLQMAYDFWMPIGDTIIASRGGVVRQIKEDSPDNGQGTDHNHIFIEHSDGTVGFYAHLMQNGVFVDVGNNVEQGDVIALAGHSGTPDIVHLHFGVYNYWPAEEGYDQAINFSNTSGPVDCRGGLIRGEYYTAE